MVAGGVSTAPSPVEGSEQEADEMPIIALAPASGEHDRAQRQRRRRFHVSTRRCYEDGKPVNRLRRGQA